MIDGAPHLRLPGVDTNPLTGVVDALGGSYFVEKLTDELAGGATAYCETIDRMGGMVEAIERGYPQKEIAEASYLFQQAVERREKIIVGVNDFVQTDEKPLEILYLDDRTADLQLQRLADLKRTRDNDRVRRTLDALKAGAQGRDNTMPLPVAVPRCNWKRSIDA